MEHCYDPACTRYKKPMTPAGVPRKDGATHNRPTCEGKKISNGLRWPVVNALLRKTEPDMLKLLAGSNNVRQVDRMAALLEQAQTAARVLSETKLKH